MFTFKQYTKFSWSNMWSEGLSTDDNADNDDENT